MGLSMGEIMVLAVIALVVVGPKDLPRILRTAGRLMGQAKRMVVDVRRETGLDQVLRGDFQDLERLADHIERLEPYRGDAPTKPLRPAIDWAAAREREYPVIGADARGLLPEDASVYGDLPTYASVEASALPPHVAPALPAASVADASSGDASSGEAHVNAPAPIEAAT